MSEFKMRSRPKKPKEEGQVSLGFGNFVSWPEVLNALEEFKERYPYIKEEDICLEYLYDAVYDWGTGLQFSAPGKSRAVYEAEMKQYKKELKEYNKWREDNKDQIAVWKKAEKERIAKNKLERKKAKLAKELAEVEAKLK